MYCTGGITREYSADKARVGIQVLGFYVFMPGYTRFVEQQGGRNTTYRTH